MSADETTDPGVPVFDAASVFTEIVRRELEAALAPLEAKIDAMTASLALATGQVRSMSSRIAMLEQHALDSTLPPPAEPM